MTPGGDILVDPDTPVAATSSSALYASPPPRLPMPYSSTSSRSSSDYLTGAATLPPPPPPPPPPGPAPSFSAVTNNPLFLPPTAGTLACFCGPTCQCVGCATHDPYSRKRPAPGACSGGGCHCGTGKGCEEEVSDVVGGGVVSKKSRNGNGGGGCCGGGGENGKKKKKQEELQLATKKPSCCGSKASAPPMSCAPSSSSSSSSSSTSTSLSTGETLPHLLLSAPPPGSAGVALPSLWSSSTFTPDTTIASSNFTPPALAYLQDLSSSNLESGTTSHTPTTTTGNAAPPLPSLRTLWPALLDLHLEEAGVSSSSSLDDVAGGSTTTMAGGEPYPAPASTTTTTTTTTPLLSEVLSRDQDINNGLDDAGVDGEPCPPYAPHHLGLPAGLFDPALEPAILRRNSPSPSATMPTTGGQRGQQDRLVLTACSACFLEEPLDDACGRRGGGGGSGDDGEEEEEEEDLGCQCTSRCGCRGGGGDDGGVQEASSTAGMEKRREQAEKEVVPEQPKANGVVRGSISVGGGGR